MTYKLSSRALHLFHSLCTNAIKLILRGSTCINKLYKYLYLILAEMEAFMVVAGAERGQWGKVINDPSASFS